MNKLSKEQFEALSKEEQDAYVQSYVEGLDTARRAMMQQKVMAKMKKDHRRQTRDANKSLGSRQVKKLQKQARRDAKALQPSAA